MLDQNTNRDMRIREARKGEKRISPEMQIWEKLAHALEHRGPLKIVPTRGCPEHMLEGTLRLDGVKYNYCCDYDSTSGVYHHTLVNEDESVKIKDPPYVSCPSCIEYENTRVDLSIEIDEHALLYQRIHAAIERIATALDRRAKRVGAREKHARARAAARAVNKVF